MPRQWTPEQRKELGERMRAARAAKKLQAAEEVVNPIANDVVAPTPVAVAPKPVKPVEKPVTSGAKSAPHKPAFSAAHLIAQLEAIPLDQITYPDCGLLLNVLSATSTKVALARRQRQEQLEAGSHRAPCKTCGRIIDISKSGGFQILSGRDEHHMMVNFYYCSQACVFAQNMPSHARSTPREKRANQA